MGSMASAPRRARADKETLASAKTPTRRPYRRREHDELLPLTAAAALLGISRGRMRALLAQGAAGKGEGLAYQRNPLDKREKLVSRADVERLLRESGRVAPTTTPTTTG